MRGRLWASALLCALQAAALGCTVFPSDDSSLDASAVAVTVLPNHALHFDGVSQYATCGTAGFPTGEWPQSVSLWVRYPSSSDAGAGTQAFLVLRRDEASGVELGIRNGTVAAWTVFGQRTLVEAPSLPTPGAWHHVAFVLTTTDGGDEAALYVDGHLSASGAAAPDSLTPVSCWIGSFDGLSELYAGDMDEIHVWNVARSAQDVVDEMEGGVTGPQAGLVAFFDGDEIAGDRLPDKSGSGNDATLGGGDPGRMPTLVPSGLSAAVAP
jgi:hypothetical protein